MAENGAITTKQRRAIVALLTAPTIGAAAKAAGVGERTLTRWLTEESFRAALRAAQDAATDEAITRLAGEARKAVETLAEIHKDEDVPAAVRVQAARAVLAAGPQLRESRELAERVAELEERMRNA